VTEHLIWVGSYDSADPKIGMLLTAYHIANLLPLLFDAEETGDWKGELMIGLYDAASRLRQYRFESNDGRVFEQRLASRSEDPLHGWVEIPKEPTP
jgi:hypothetical protein